MPGTIQQVENSNGSYQIKMLVNLFIWVQGLKKKSNCWYSSQFLIVVTFEWSPSWIWGKCQGGPKLIWINQLRKPWLEEMAVCPCFNQLLNILKLLFKCSHFDGTWYQTTKNVRDIFSKLKKQSFHTNIFFRAVSDVHVLYRVCFALARITNFRKLVTFLYWKPTQFIIIIQSNLLQLRINEGS